MPVIEKLTAIEVLDSRGRPTVKATCRLRRGHTASASVPSGASTGKAEALELRDGDKTRFGGLGCRKAVRHINHEMNAALSGREFDGQVGLDRAMIELDGTGNKSRLGANAILAVSIAFARADAIRRGVALYRHLAEMVENPLVRLPRLAVNLFSGGKHAGGQVPIQDVLVVPLSAATIDQALTMMYAIYQSAAALSQSKYGARPLVADEGGLAPPFSSCDAMLSDAADAIRGAGLEPGRDAALAVDVAASHFFDGGRYFLAADPLDSRQMIEQLARWTREYPIISIEDGLAEEDWPNWPALCESLAGRAAVIGDDLLCTNPTRIRKAIESKAADALLLKVNQVGTLTEAAEALHLARSANWSVTISARSGETEDDWLADLAVGWSGDFIKVGSITRSERLAKYNRLLEIENELKSNAD